MKSFEYAWPVKVFFGNRPVKNRLSEVLKNYGPNIMLAYGGGSVKKTGIYDEVVQVLKDAGKKIIDFGGLMPNPSYAKVCEGIELYRRENVDLILAVGGGSVIDCVKIICAGVYADGDLWEEQIDHHRIAEKMGRFAAVVTMTGAGAEMDCLGACTDEERNLKSTFTGPYAEFVMFDPEYIMKASVSVFMPGVFDSLSHCMETFFGNVTNVHDEMNIGLMRNIVRNMRKLSAGEDTEEVRSDLMWDSSLIQMFLLNAGKPGDFQAHLMENMLCAYSHGTHGKQLAVLHPLYYRILCKHAVEKFAWFAEAVFDIKAEGKDRLQVAEEGIDALEQLIKDAGLPLSFSECGYELSEEVAETIAENFPGSAGAYHVLTKEEVAQILIEGK